LHIHKNVPGVLSAINTALSSNNINILGQYLKTNELIGYVVLDVDHKLSARALSLLREIPGSIRARMLY
jgi:D-3-phosphoglycerate dehydrogenase